MTLNRKTVLATAAALLGTCSALGVPSVYSMVRDGWYAVRVRWAMVMAHEQFIIDHRIMWAPEIAERQMRDLCRKYPNRCDAIAAEDDE